MAKEYLYGLRARPLSIGAQPKGHTLWIDEERIAPNIKKMWSKENYRHGIVGYPRELTTHEIKTYELVDLNTDPLSTKWDEFVEFATNLVDYEISYEQFVADFIHPRGELRRDNPLHEMNPMDFFKLLENKGFPGKMKGLEKFYNQL